MPQPELPRFSVVIANYNHAALVGRAIDSVLAQDYPAERVELIVVDDGSTDDSRERLQAWAQHPGVRLVMQENRGQTAAFAAGVAVATGDYVCLLDADDRCHLDKLAALAAHIATLDTTPDQLFLCHDLEILDGADGAAITSTWFNIIDQRRFGPHLHLAAAHHFFPFSVTSGMVFGRTLLTRAVEAVPLWEWPMGADGILGHTAMLMAGEVHYLPRVLGSYIVHGDNNFARIVDGQFRQKPVWHDRWPRKLRFLELLLDSMELSEHERAERQAYLGRLEHVVKAAPASRRYPQPLLSLVIDAQGVPAAWAGDTAAACARLRDSHHELIWVGDADTLAALPPACVGASVETPAMATDYDRLRAGFGAARGGYLAFLGAGDQPDPLFSARHLQAHRFGGLPMLTASDLRLVDADGVLLHLGIMGTANGWGGGATQIPAFGHLLRDWPLAPLPALVLRRTPFLQAFFAAESLPVDPRLTGWLLGHFLIQMGGGSRLQENLMDLRLPAAATPNASWLSQFVDRRGPVPSPDLAAAAEALFAAYARAGAESRAYFSEAWEARFVRWLLQSGGAQMPARLEHQAQQATDAVWGRRILGLLRQLLAKP